MNLNSVFITGATSGIGLETARQLAPHTKTLILNGRRQERLEKIKQELSAKCEVHLACFDVRDRQQAEDWFLKNQNILKNLNVLVNNAGLARGTDPLHKGNVDHWDEMIDTNVRGLLYITRQLLPFMVEQKKGTHCKYWFGGGAVELSRWSRVLCHQVFCARHFGMFAYGSFGHRNSCDQY